VVEKRGIATAQFYGPYQMGIDEYALINEWFCFKANWGVVLGPMFFCEAIDR